MNILFFGILTIFLLSFKIPTLFFALQRPNTTANWGFYAEKSNKASKSMKNGAHWPRGRMLGGSHGNYKVNLNPK